jgi:origin recognition complex subunit 1
MQPELDMLPERLQLWQEQEEEERREYDAVFYNSFQQETRGSQPATFSVGQTVAVSTQALYKRDKAPSIAVIIAMWELVARDQIEAENENDEDEDPKAGQMMVRVHWFLRPTELAAIRVKREHGEVCVILAYPFSLT